MGEPPKTSFLSHSQDRVQGQRPPNAVFPEHRPKRQEKPKISCACMTCQALCHTFLKIYFPKVSFTIKCMHSKHTAWWILANVYAHVIIPTIKIWKHFYCQRFPCVSPQPTPIPAPSPRLYHWSSFYHYWSASSFPEFHIESYCMQSFVSGCFSLSKMFLRIIHNDACIRSSFFYYWVEFHCMNRP